MIPPDIRRQHDDFGNCPELLSPEDAAALDEGRWDRAGGAVVCDVCGKQYYDHPNVIGALWLTRVCDGSLVKL
jgi:hypothetical protein